MQQQTQQSHHKSYNLMSVHCLFSLPRALLPTRATRTSHVDDVSSLGKKFLGCCCSHAIIIIAHPCYLLSKARRVIDQMQTKHIQFSHRLLHGRLFREETIMLLSLKWRYASWHLFARSYQQQTHNTQERCSRTVKWVRDSREFLVWLELLSLVGRWRWRRTIVKRESSAQKFE